MSTVKPKADRGHIVTPCTITLRTLYLFFPFLQLILPGDLFCIHNVFDAPDAMPAVAQMLGSSA